MRKIANAVILLFVVSMLASCMSMHSRSVIVLNPDMSGKCTYEIKMGKDMAGILTMAKGEGLSSYENYFKPTKSTTQDAAMALASKLLSSGKVDAWKDVQFGYLKKDTVFFRGTAYFKDISKMAVSMFDSSMRVYKDANGNMVLEMSEMKRKSDTTITWKNHSYDSLLNNNIYKNLGLSDIMHYYMASMIKGLDISATYQLPGKIISSSNFVRKGDNTVSISLTGNDVIKLLDTIASNNSIMGDVYSKYLSGLGGKDYDGGSGMQQDDSYTYYKLLYGEAKPVKVVFKGDGKPVFDYAKEVAEAKLSYAKFRKASGLEKFDSLQAAAKREEEAEKQREQGTLVLTAADSANQKVYFKTLTASQLYGNDISFTGILSKPQQYSYDVKVKITKAVTDNGSNVKDSINSYNYILRYDTNQTPPSITAYLTSSTYTYSSGEYGDSVATNDKVTFSLYTDFPKDTKYLNLEGELDINYDYGVTAVPFKIINLYIKPESNSGLGKW